MGDDDGLERLADARPAPRRPRVRSVTQSGAANRLLAALPRKTRESLRAQCDLVELGVAEVLCKPTEAIRHVYFPIDCIISLVSPIIGHPSLQISMIGNEGMFGASLFLNVEKTPLGALVQHPGSALRINAPSFLGLLKSSLSLQREVHRYIYVLLAQIAQSSACIRFHLLDARLARWLLMTHDRMQSNELHLTHEVLARMLGMRRVGITNAAGMLQKRRLISYSRGEIRILDRPGLEAVTCECYRADNRVYDQILGAPVTAGHPSHAHTPVPAA